MDHDTTTAPEMPEFADDLLHGAEAISVFLFGSEKCKRRVYYLAERTRMPFFRIGSMLCARKSVILRYFSQQESRAAPIVEP